MNIISILILINIFILNIANADVYVITDKNNSVYSVSDQPDALVPNGYILTVIKGQDIHNLPIIDSPQFYNFNNGSFILNKAAVQARQAAQAKEIANQTIQEQAKASAISKLTDAISRVATQDVLTSQELQALLSGN